MDCRFMAKLVAGDAYLLALSRRASALSPTC